MKRHRGQMFAHSLLRRILTVGSNVGHVLATQTVWNKGADGFTGQLVEPIAKQPFSLGV